MLILATLGLAGPWLVRAWAAGRPQPGNDGEYTVRITGWYAGTATATVQGGTPGRVSIHGRVSAQDAPDRTLNFVAANLRLDGIHFAGRANIQGDQVDIRGRLDGYTGDATFRGARLLATYTSSANHSGRIAGTFTVQPSGAGSPGGGGGSGNSGSNPGTGTGTGGSGNSNSGTGNTGTGGSSNNGGGTSNTGSGNGNSGSGNSGNGGGGSTGNGGNGNNGNHNGHGNGGGNGNGNNGNHNGHGNGNGNSGGGGNRPDDD